MSAIDHRAQPIFFAALERGTEDWCVFLEKVCGSDTDLRSRVEQLLHAHQALGSIRTGGAETPTADFAPAETPGTMIGPYKIVELIGEGGMGAVYLAQQTEPVKRLVALKVIKAGMDSKQVLARFEAERQALALMDHPNIARVLDAGTTSGVRNQESGVSKQANDSSSSTPDTCLLTPDSGRPYFVMELVKGVPITKFCDERKLTPRERLELFLPVCYAIQHAHQKGIIHRDIKPTNVLVAMHDGKPVPKVIDFGVAKAAGQALTERTLVTGLGAVVGTPEYMSPEQAELNQLDIDTRSDVYSLGILLYELLTGTTPLTRKRVKGTALLEILRVIREEEPQKPSTRLSTADELPSIAAKRGTEPARLSRQFRGEIDWIVMKALEKDRGRRYETANGLAADVRRYLAGETVQAVPPSVAYRFRKFARRNKPALISAVLLSGMLLALVGSLGWVVSDRAARRARMAFEVNQFLGRAETLYAANKLPEAVAEAQKARGVVGTGGDDEELHRLVQQRLTDLDMAAKLEEIRMEFKEPTARDRVFDRFARVFREYGIDVEVLPVDEAAAEIAASHIKIDLALALDQWALCLQYDDRPLDRARWERLFAISQAADPDPWRQRCNAAYEARDCQALREIAEGADLGRLRTRTLAGLGDSLRDVGEVEASVAFLRRVQRLHPDDYSVNSSLAWGLRSLNPPQWDDAIAFGRVAVALRPDSYVARLNLGYALQVQGKVDEAIACYEKVIELEPNHAEAHFNLGIARRDRGKLAEAIASLKRASDLLPNDPYPQYGLAWELATCAEPSFRDPARAVALAKKAVDLSVKQGDDRDKPGQERLGSYWNTLGVAHYRAGQMKEAVAALQKSMDLCNGGDCKDWFFLAMAYWKLEKKDEARKWYDRGAEWMAKKASKDDDHRRFRAEAAELLGVKE